MILQKTLVKLRANEISTSSGIDNYEVVKDKKHWLNYPYQIEYRFNSRGFRDSEWPNNEVELKKSIWCIGDSFTSGVGIPFSHTWPQVLKQISKVNTINISLDGASNNWITRQASYILNEITPTNLVIQWSFVNRREKDHQELTELAWEKFYSRIKDPTWPNVTYKNYKNLPKNLINEIESNPFFEKWIHEIDYGTEARLRFINSSLEEDYENFQKCLNILGNFNQTNIIHTFIPYWHLGTWESEGQYIYEKFNWHNQKVIKEIRTLDYGRDNFHYDLLTAEKLCKLINSALV